MSTAYLEGMLRDVFAAQGAIDAAGLARKAVLGFERDQRDAKIYELRACMTQAEVAERFCMTPDRVKQIIREQHQLRKSKVG